MIRHNKQKIMFQYINKTLQEKKKLFRDQYLDIKVLVTYAIKF